MAHAWHNDEVLIAALEHALRGDPAVPSGVRMAGYAAYTWRDIDAELAALTYDSTLEDAVLSGARSQQQAPLRAMTFASSSMTIEIEVGPAGLLGQIVPPHAGQIHVVPQEGESRPVEPDENGCFTVSPIPACPFRLQMTGDTTVTTAWITL
jgi:hypothetical protein